jgi:mRNA-degrading endonuclease RelE of RelBE toxin-antitoxin system
MMSVVFATGFFQAMNQLAAKEQAACTSFITMFQSNPKQPGISLERLAKGKHLWSGRVTQELRAILYQDDDAWLLLHVDHHDAAYRWAEHREIGRHPVTGALQIIDVIETVIEKKVEKKKAAGLFDDRDDAYLISLGVPPTWLPVVRQIATDDDLLEVGAKLPEDVFDRLLRLNGGELVTPPAPVPATKPLEIAASASAGFYVVTDAADLAAVLAAPLDRWIAFLHPSQRAIVDASPRGAIKVTGSAGTGKTVVAMHRARTLARRHLRVLLTSFVTTLCENLQRNLRKLCTKDELARIVVTTIDKQALAIARKVDGKLQPAVPEQVKKLVSELAGRHAAQFPPAFVVGEWEAVVDAHGLATWAEYRTASRTGRGKPLSVADRKVLWQVYGNVLATLGVRHEATWSILCRRATAALETGEVKSPFDAVIVDELQDLRPTALRLIRALVGPHPEYLMLVGDAGQRIYAGKVALSSLGIDVRGRSHVLRLNYRTTEQIRRAADLIASESTDDLDDGAEDRTSTRSLLRGPSPTFAAFPQRPAELIDAVRWIKECRARGIAAEEIAAFSRTTKRSEELEAKLSSEGVAAAGLDDEHVTPGAIQVGTMHRAKGLEFKAVLVIDASADTLPSPGLMKSAIDPQDRDNALARERQLLYVAMTRARDLVRVTWTGKPSPFLVPVLSSEEASTT